jgi:hypothetical protein
MTSRRLGDNRLVAAIGASLFVAGAMMAESGMPLPQTYHG